jgi:hypothetical protein
LEPVDSLAHQGTRKIVLHEIKTLILSFKVKLIKMQN